VAETSREQFTRFCQARDLAAYRMVGCLDCAIFACRCGNSKEALAILSEARAIFNRANAEVENFKRLNFKKENSPHGNRTAV